MALKSTIHKAELHLADLDRAHFADHALTIARHPSETGERMMIRLLAFALNASPTLAIGRGLSTDSASACPTRRPSAAPAIVRAASWCSATAGGAPKTGGSGSQASSPARRTCGFSHSVPATAWR